MSLHFSPRTVTILAIALLMALFALSLMTGSVPLTINEVWGALMGHNCGAASVIVPEMRLPASLTAVLSGMSLAAAGLVMQTLFSNALADPSLLGVTSGASLGVAVALLLLGGSWVWGVASVSGTMLTIAAAFVGACGVIVLITACSHWVRGNVSLLVVGIMLSFVFSALVSLLSFYATDSGVHQFAVWSMGTFTGMSMARLPIMTLLTLVPCAALLLMSRWLNALLLGADYATNLGINVKHARTVLLAITGLLTATITALCGPIAFIGLAVPHMARLLLRTANHERLMPFTMLMGANVALLSLIITALPGEGGTLPLAAITPLLGAPMVMYLLMRRQ